MKRVLILITVIVLIFTVNAFGQTQRKKRVLHNLPEVDDEVLVAVKPKTSKRRKSVKTIWDDTDIVHRQRRTKAKTSATNRKKGKYANQEVSYKKKPKTRRKN
jgi:uncharacterized membrane protein